MNGTLRNDEDVICMNCGFAGHRRTECPEKPNVTNSIVCKICGGVGHMQKDCIHRNNPEYLQRSAQMDKVYENFLAELGETGGSSAATNAAANPLVATGPYGPSSGHEPMMHPSRAAAVNAPPGYVGYATAQPPYQVFITFNCFTNINSLAVFRGNDTVLSFSFQ